MTEEKEKPSNLGNPNKLRKISKPIFDFQEFKDILGEC